MATSSNFFLSSPGVAPNPRYRLEPGARLGRFIVGRHLGSGAVGDVYLAQDTLGEREAAIKVVDAGPCGSKAAAAELKREVAAYSLIQDHRHVLKVYDMHQVPYEGTELLLVSMEHADGGTLRDWLLAHRDDPDARRTQGLAFFEQAARGLAECQAAGVLCADTKPENIFLVNGVAKIGDLGMAWNVDDPAAGSRPAGATRSAEMCFGTPEYASPDAWKARHPGDLDFRAVVYSLGVMLYEILDPEGRLPFEGSAPQLRELHLYEAPPPLPGAGETEARVVQRCLEKDPARRYASVQELLDDLQDGPSPCTEETGEDAGVEEPREGAGVDETEAEWQQACAAAEESRFREAEQVCRSILRKCPPHAGARELLAELQHRHRQAHRIYAAIEQEFGTAGLTELSTLLTEAVETYPDHPSGAAVQIRLDLRTQQYRQTMEDAVAAIQNGNWGAAQSHLDVAGRLNPGAREVDELARFAGGIRRHVEEERRRIDAAIEEDDEEKALALAENLERYLAEATGADSVSEGGEST